MCGICGLYAPDLADSLDSIVARMNAALQHRGPDDSGQFTGRMCSIAMRRLAIIDLKTGHQPIANEDGTLHIVYNGEIYNYPQLRDSLVQSGRHSFRTETDTEVLLHLYEDEGPQMLSRLHGMFAFCIHDQRDNSLFLARDRFGEKPLFYTLVDAAFAFSSEIASLLEWPGVLRRLDFEALYFYLYQGFVPAPLTLFEGVFQLPPGHWLRWKDGACASERYFQPVYSVNPELRDETTAAEALRAQLLAAVKSQMMSDVPLGAFLSGGIDSSAVVAAMQRQSSQPVKTFTARFEYAPYDESPVARQVAQHLGTEHHEFVISNAGFSPDDLWRIVRHVGQPFSDSSAIPTYFISREIRDHVTVALSGDGGDENFAGYDYFQWMLRIDRLASRVPQPLLALGDETLKAATRAGLRWNPIRQARRAAEIGRRSPMQRLQALGTLFEPHELSRMASPLLSERWPSGSGVGEASKPSFARLDQLLAPTASMSRLRQMMYYRTLFSLPEDMLVKVDRMSMAASLEVRAPMLSAELSDLAAQMPEDLLINKTGKYILRAAVRDWLPDIVFSHPKTGFSIPLHIFQNDAYRKICQELLLSGQQPLIKSLFQPLDPFVRRGLEQHSDSAEHSVYRVSHQLWSLLQLAAWAHTFDVSL